MRIPVRRRRYAALAGVLACALLGARGVAAQAAPAPPPSVPLEIEIAQLDSAGTLCMRREGALPPGTRVWLVQPDTPQSVAEAVPGPGRCLQRLPEAKEPLVALRVLGGVLDSTRLSIAIAGASARPLLRRGLASVDLDGDGTPERFRACTSMEGVHLTVWSGPPLRGRLRWHRYFYLGYDVEPSCTAADGREPAPGAALGRAQPPSD